MGIVARCPNGHRIKVKDELAGRKGICPTCSARFRIPRKDSAPEATADSPAGALDRPPMARVVSLDPLALMALPKAYALDEADAVDTAEPLVELSDAVPDFAPADSDAAVAGFAGAEESVDESIDDVAGDDTLTDDASANEAQPLHAALDERPDLAWCVAVRGGAPSAPLDTEALRTWLESGEASVDHVVWRQDWPEWRPIQDVFPDAVPPGPPGWP